MPDVLDPPRLTGTTLTLLGTAGSPPIVPGCLGIAFALTVDGATYLVDLGTGSCLLRSQETFRIADGLAAICVIAAAGWCINAVLLQLDRRLLHWHYATTAH